MSWPFVVQQLINAAVVSALYGLLAVSYVLMHGITNRTNLALGALAIWAGYIVINLSLFLMLKLPGMTLVPVALAALYALLNTTIVGVLIERSTIRPLIGAPGLAMIVATLGVAIMLEELMRLQNASRDLWLMPILNERLQLGGTARFPLSLTAMQAILLAVAGVLGAGLFLFIERHPFGRAWRACAQDLGMAELTGVDVGRTLLATFAIASAATAAAGILLAVNYGSVSFYSGLVIGLKTLFVAVVGGLGSVGGAFAGAALLGLVETFWSACYGAEYRDVASFVLLTGLLILFPGGLFTGTGRIDHKEQ